MRRWYAINATQLMLPASATCAPFGTVRPSIDEQTSKHSQRRRT